MITILFFFGWVVGMVVSTNWPIVGVFSQPTTLSDPSCGGNCTYIAASYVKFLESAGVRVVPVNYFATEPELDHLFASLNGFLFTGGASAFPHSAQYIFDKTVDANKNGDFMPLWGTCMGFQWLIISASRNIDILDPPSGQMDAYNLSIPLDFTAAADSSKMFRSAPSNVRTILATENVTMNNHHYGIWTDHFNSTTSLVEFYNVLSTNKDRLGREFVSTIEAFDYPIYGVQWHPEKNPFEWGLTEEGIPEEAINHSPTAILAAQYPAFFFASEARRSNHVYASPAEEDAALIYNYKPTKTTFEGSSFVQRYFFHF